MNSVFANPLSLLAVAFISQLLAAWIGHLVRRKSRLPETVEHGDLGTILPAALTLLALIIGFSFSMSVSRYDLRKNYEEAEANAIGTEYVRADLLPAAEKARVKDLLAQYTDQRIQYYVSRDLAQLQQNDAQTANLQSALWKTVAGPTLAQPTPVGALVASGMNDVLNSQGYTQAAWLNRVPFGAWVLMIMVAVVCNFLLGFSERRTTQATLLVFPVIVTMAFFLIADIDSPRGGIIRVVPQNLIALSQSLKTQ